MIARAARLIICMQLIQFYELALISTGGDRIRENLAFRRHNEVSPAKSEVFPAERD
jgi:hypothetical protein